MASLFQNKEKETFRFKEFSIDQESCMMKVGTDGILLGAWADVSAAQSILDIGTGTGLIALMMAQRSMATIDAIEIDEEAWEQAMGNFEQSKWNSRLKALHIPVQDFAKQSKNKYDLIVSNPPFFSGGVFSANEGRAYVRHTIKLPSGDLLAAARNLLSTAGKFCVILPVIEGLRFKEMARSYGLYCNKIANVSPFPDKPANRMLLEFEKTQKALIEDHFAVRNNEMIYTHDFTDLTKEFYLNNQSDQKV